MTRLIPATAAIVAILVLPPTAQSPDPATSPPVAQGSEGAPPPVRQAVFGVNGLAVDVDGVGDRQPRAPAGLGTAGGQRRGGVAEARIRDRAEGAGNQPARFVPPLDPRAPSPSLIRAIALPRVYQGMLGLCKGQSEVFIVPERRRDLAD